MDTLDFLAQCQASINARGKFVSRKDAAKLGIKSTGEDAAEALHFDGEADFTSEDKVRAGEALNWARGYSGDNSFLKTIASKVALDSMLFNNADLASWVLPAYERETNGASNFADMADYANSVYYGQEGDEAVFAGNVIHVITTKGGRFGPQQYVGITDNKNHFFLWKTSGGRADKLRPGQSVRVVATVKGHSDYKGVKQTLIQRPKFV